MELLPCPFCGGSPSLLKEPGLSDLIRCFDCGIMTNQLTVEQWNRRAPPQAAAEKGGGE